MNMNDLLNAAKDALHEMETSAGLTACDAEAPGETWQLDFPSAEKLRVAIEAMERGDPYFVSEKQGIKTQ